MGIHGPKDSGAGGQGGSLTSRQAIGARQREFRRFLDIALGSLSELSYLLLLSRDLNCLSGDKWGQLEALRHHAGRLTWGLYRSLSTQTVPLPRSPAALPKTSAQD
jgi:hypothetical protein